MSGGQILVLILCLAGMLAVAAWGIYAGELERDRLRDERERAGRLRHELARHDTDDPPRWIR